MRGFTGTSSSNMIILLIHWEAVRHSQFSPPLTKEYSFSSLCNITQYDIAHAVSRTWFDNTLNIGYILSFSDMQNTTYFFKALEELVEWGCRKNAILVNFGINFCSQKKKGFFFICASCFLISISVFITLGKSSFHSLLGSSRNKLFWHDLVLVQRMDKTMK